MEGGFTFNPNSYNNFLSGTNTTSGTSSASGIIFDSCSSSFINMMSSTCANPIMNSKIWSKLPETLVDRVIAFLPPPAFFDARSVCKRWSNLLISNSFIEMYLCISSSARQRHTWFLFFKHKKLKKHNSSSREGYLFDPNEMKWYKISFGSVIPSGFSPCSSSGGLICWVSDIYHSILMMNTITTRTPRLFPSVGLNVTNSSLDVVVAGDDLISQFNVKNVSSEIYHVYSSGGGGGYSLWGGTTSELPEKCSLQPGGKMVFVDGKFHCMSYSPFNISGYDVGLNEWFEIEAPMRRHLRSPNLVECRGRLVLVAAVEKSKLKVPKSLRMWQKKWLEAEKMTQNLYKQFSEAGGDGDEGFDCVGNGNFIIITLPGSDNMLLFDFYQKAWQWIPPCPYSGGDGGLRGFAYEPQLFTPILAWVSPHQSGI
ncbi:hypothetical protein MKW98_019218 [Papaver atlanticum]|uniref:F-box domain-containing protein n=1 Tax=Papaver atlanticum TaxID=357466 RepID=A0AAD4TBM5_9MAGN|nr:hypothetical protein MKW98_019218 [Papaver atlanticum]